MAVVFTYTPPKINGAAAMHLAIDAAEEEGAKALLKAALPLVPFREGELYASGDYGHDGQGGYVTFSAVNPQDGYDYAGIQHEREDFSHEHGQAHYLIDPMHGANGAHGAVMAAELAELRKVL